MGDRVHVFAADAWVTAAADYLADAIAASVGERGGCRLALAGGSTPAPVYQRLAKIERVPWSHVTFFFGDERAVGPEDEASNYAMARRTLFDPLGVPGDRIARIEGERAPEDARAHYATRLGDVALDLVLLGMGGDGHTASLFPGSDGAGATGPVVVTTSPIAPATRISLTYDAIGEAGEVVFLVGGASKASRLAEVHAQRRSDTPTLPAARVHDRSGHATWLLDDAAAAELSPQLRQGTRR